MEKYQTFIRNKGLSYSQGIDGEVPNISESNSFFQGNSIPLKKSSVKLFTLQHNPGENKFNS